MAHPRHATAEPVNRATSERLGPEIKAAAFRATGDWVWKVLEDDTAVWMRINVHMTKELLISVPGHVDLGTWAKDCDRLLAMLENLRPFQLLESGHRTEPDGEPVTIARYVERVTPSGGVTKRDQHTLL
jgi:hypothetical protein